METVVTRPSSVLAGDHQLVAPLPVDGTSYIEPTILGVDGWGYLTGDANADGLIDKILTLPDVGLAPSAVSIAGVDFLPYTNTSGTSWNVPCPGITVVAGDLAVVDCISQEAVDVAAPSTPSGWTSRGSWGSATGWIPRVTRFFKIMSGGESGTLVTVATASARFHFVSRIIRGVDLGAYFAAAAATNASGQGTANPGPDPASITTTADGAMMEIMAAVNIFPGGDDLFDGSHVSAGYELDANTASDERGVVIATKIKATAGAEDPGVFARSFDNWTVILDAYKPAQNAGLTLLVASLMSDPTETDVPATEPSLAANEIQTVTSTLPSGTFTLTYAGQTTAPINWNDSAATVQTRLRDLSNIGASDVVCSGGPLNLAPVQVEFQSALANTDVVLMTDNSASVSIVETQKGHPDVTFAWEGSVNCPRWLDGAPWETGSAPQINFWSATPSSYIAGTKLSVTASDHDGNNTVSALLIVIADALVSNPISDTFGSAVGALAKTQATFGAITPGIAGSKILAVLGISNPSGNYSSSPNPGTPNRYTRVSKVESDRSVLDVSISPPAAAAADTPNAVQWSGSNDFVTGLMAIQPAGSAGSLTLDEVLADADQTTWADIATALGSMYEIVELDVSAIPANAIITAAAVEVQHAATARSLLRVVLVGIDADDTVHPCAELRANGYPTDSGGAVTTISTGSWVETADGTSLDEFDRFGVALFSTTLNPVIENHRIYAVSATFQYEPGGPVVSNVVGPATAGDSITWDYTSDAGLSQTHVQVRIRHGASQLEGVVADAYPANPLNPATGEIVYDSGKLPGSLRRALQITDAPLSRGSQTVSVRAWTRLSSGREVVSEWATANFDITGSPPTTGTQSTQPTFSKTTGGVSVSVVAPASVARAWLVRSTDGGTTWTLAGPFTVTPSATNVLVDYEAPLARSTLRYQVTFDNGAMRETGTPSAVGSGDIATLIDDWYLIVPGTPALNQVIDVAGFDMTRPRAVYVADNPERTVVVSSAALGSRFRVTLRTITPAARTALLALLDSGEEMRLVSILGESWWVKLAGEIQEGMLRGARPTGAEVTRHRSAHRYELALVETRRA
jgi:hypothetical protein